MTENVYVTKKESEHSAVLLKKFSQFFRSSGVLPRVKSLKFNERKNSKFKIKKEKLRKIEKQKINERKKKLGQTK